MEEEILDIQTELGDVVRTCYNVEKINRCANEKVKESNSRYGQATQLINQLYSIK